MFEGRGGLELEKEIEGLGGRSISRV